MVDDLTKVCDWSDPALQVKDIPGKGLGVVTSRPFETGDLLIVFGGRVVTKKQLIALSCESDNAIQIEEGLFLIPVDFELNSIADRLNHSCEPNAGFSSSNSIVAISSIPEGNEICIDYASCSAEAEVQPPFECNCGTTGCRRLLTALDWKLPKVRSQVGAYFQPFLKRRIARELDGGHDE